MTRGPLQIVGGDAPNCEDGVCAVPDPVDAEPSTEAPGAETSVTGTPRAD